MQYVDQLCFCIKQGDLVAYTNQKEYEHANTNRNLYILIVEDEDSLRNNLARFLRFHGYNVTTAKNGVQALESIRLHEFQVLLIDLRLPDMNGMDILKEINLAGLNIACMVITAYASLKTVIDAFKYGACDYLEKPFQLAELEQKIKHFDVFK